MSFERNDTPPSGFGTRCPRVFHIIWWIPHYRAAIFRRLSQNPGLEFTVLAGDNASTKGGACIASAADAGLGQGIRWRKVLSRRIQGPLLHGYEWQPEAVRAVWKEQPDAVIVLGNKSLSTFLIRAICRLRRIPLLDWTIGIRRPETGMRWVLRRILYAAWPNAHLLYGNFARDWYVKQGMDPSRLFVVRNSLDYERQVAIRNCGSLAARTRTRARWGAGGERARLIVHLGRLEQDKRIEVLLEALRLARGQNLDIQLVILGDGRARKDLESQAGRLGVAGAAHFLGECYDEEVIGDILLASDLCVAPGPVGLVAMHALVYGTPLLACENTSWIHGPEIEAIVEGKTGAFFRENDSAHLAEKLAEMLYPISVKPRMEAECRRVVDMYYTPAYQERVVIEALNSVLPAGRRLSPTPDQPIVGV